jgi:hypothetical protein
LFFCSLLLLPGMSVAQEPQNNGKRVTTARFTDQTITVDGRLDESAWQTAEVITGFTQKEPEEGKALTELTEVRLLYNKEFLYIAAYCFDRTPDGIVVNDISRDFDFLDQDYFAVVLDTFNDDRNGYYLGTTALGGQRDLQFFNEGRNQNVNWDGAWYTEGRKVEDGYTVEMAIPFRTLRFSRQPAQVWGAQFIRRIRRRNEVGFWSPLSRRYTGVNGVAFAGELRGMENVEPGRNLQVKPYALAGVTRLASRGEGAEGDFDGGMDLKYGLTPGISLDLTLNTDFSHVEADTQQINLTRFPLFFEEKREFFLENAGIFQFGSLQNSEALLFHSRTIGLAGGQPIPILGGARVSGRAGDYYLGLLNMQTRSEGSTPATNFTVSRLRRNILQNSDVGVMFLNRQSRMRDDHNRAFGSDANFLFFRNDLRISGAFAKTYTPGLAADDRLGKVEGVYQRDLWLASSSYVDIGKNFNPEMGFVRRSGRRLIGHEFQFRPRLSPETRVGALVRDLYFTVNSDHVLLSTGKTETKYLLMQFRTEFQDGGIFGTHREENFERLLEPFEISDGIILPPGDYRFNESKVWYFSNRSKPLSGNVEYLWSDFYSGKRKELVLEGRVRPSYRLSTAVNYQRNDIDLPEGAFTTNLVGLRLDYSFNPKMFLNAFVQYNSEEDEWSSNIRFRLIHRPLSDIYVVYNDARDLESKTTDWSLTLKYTHLFNF